MHLTALYRARGQAHELRGHFDQACSDFEQALATARTAEDHLAEWQSVMDLGLLWAGRNYARTGEYFRRALDLAQSLHDPPLQASSLNCLGNWLVNTGDIINGIAAHQQARAVFQQRDDQRGMAETLDLLGMAYGQLGDLPNAVLHYRQAITVWRALDEHRSLSSSLVACGMWAGNCTNEPAESALVPFADCQHNVEEGLRLAHRTEWLAGQAFAEVCLAMVFASFGRFGAALSHAGAGFQIASQIEHQQWIAGAHWSLGETYGYLLDPDRALQHLEPALSLAETLGLVIWIGVITTNLALAWLAKGELTRAAATLERALPREQAPRSMHERRISWAWG